MRPAPVYCTFRFLSCSAHEPLPHAQYWPGWFEYANPALFYDEIQFGARCAQLAAALDRCDPDFYEHDAATMLNQARALLPEITTKGDDDER